MNNSRNRNWAERRAAFENRIIDDSIQLCIDIDEKGNVTISQYDAETTDWNDFGINYSYWNFREEFLRDIEHWYGADAVQAYGDALAMAPIMENKEMNKYLINLTQHPLTEEQRNSVDCTIEPKGMEVYLNFDSMPTAEIIEDRAYEMFGCLMQMLPPDVEPTDCTVLLGGAPFFMSACERAATHYGFKYCYAFSKRVSEEVKQPDGTVKKVSVFKHEGWIKF